MPSIKVLNAETIILGPPQFDKSLRLRFLKIEFSVEKLTGQKSVERCNLRLFVHGYIDT